MMLSVAEIKLLSSALSRSSSIHVNLLELRRTVPCLPWFRYVSGLCRHSEKTGSRLSHCKMHFPHGILPQSKLQLPESSRLCFQSTSISQLRSSILLSCRKLLTGLSISRLLCEIIPGVTTEINIFCIFYVMGPLSYYYSIM